MVCFWRQPVHEIYIIVLVNLHPYESGSIQFDPFMSVSLSWRVCVRTFASQLWAIGFLQINMCSLYRGICLLVVIHCVWVDARDRLCDIIKRLIFQWSWIKWALWALQIELTLERWQYEPKGLHLPKLGRGSQSH